MYTAVFQASAAGSREWVEITIASPGSGTIYCVTATHSLLPAADAWKTAVYNSSDGSPAPSDLDAC